MRPRLNVLTLLQQFLEYLNNNTKNLGKPPVAMENGWHFKDFKDSFLPNHSVSLMLVPAEGDINLKVYQLDISRTYTDPPKSKKAIVHIIGNTGYVAKNLPQLEPFVRTICEETAKQGENVKISFFCQDYRARGFNKKIEEESYCDFSMNRDALDQAELIKKLIKDGYKPEDIIIHTHSYGSGVALWMLYHLIQNEGIEYANIKLFCDRGYGNYIDYPLLDILQAVDTPFETKAEIVKKDETYTANDHFTTHPSLLFSHLGGIQSHQLIQALLLEKPINMRFPFDVTCFNGFVQGYKMGEKKNDYIPLAPHVYEDKNPVASDPAEITVKSRIVGALLKRLHEYCLFHAKRAKKSGEGGDYKHNWVKKIGWTAREQLEVATGFMAALSQQPPDWNLLLAMRKEEGPHHSGKMKPIFKDIVLVAEEMQRLQAFNKQILSLKPNREKRAEDKLRNFARNRTFNVAEVEIKDDYQPGVGMKYN